MRHSHLMLAAVLLLGGCVKELGNESPGPGVLGEVVLDCVVPMPSEIESWGAPRSIEWADRSLWIWSDVILAGGAWQRNVGAYVASAADACDGALTFVTDATGVPAPLVTLTPEEEQENAARTDGRHVELSITGGFVHQGRASVYYEKILRGPDFLDTEVLGMGLCRIQQPGAACVRERPGACPEEPTLLWRSRRTWNRGAFVDDDGYAYLFGCDHAAAFEDLCTLARVRPDDAGDPTAYRFHNENEGWIEDPWNATVLLETAGMITPGYVAHLDRYLLVTPNIWDSTVDARLAPAPWGSYEILGPLFAAIPSSEGWFIGGGVEHAALRREDGRTIAVTYFTDGIGAEGLHLVTFRFDDEIERNVP